MGYYDDDRPGRFSQALLGGALALLFLAARWVYQLPWAQWWHWLTGG